MIKFIKFMFWVGFFVFIWWSGILTFILWFWAAVFTWIGTWLL